MKLIYNAGFHPKSHLIVKNMNTKITEKYNENTNEIFKKSHVIVGEI